MLIFLYNFLVCGTILYKNSKFCIFMALNICPKFKNSQQYMVFKYCIPFCELGGLVVSALDFQDGISWVRIPLGSRQFLTIITPSSYSTCPGLSIKWTGRRLVTDSGTKCALVIHESKAVQIHVHHSNRRCLYVSRVPGSVKNPHNNNNHIRFFFVFFFICFFRFFLFFFRFILRPVYIVSKTEVPN